MTDTISSGTQRAIIKLAETMPRQLERLNGNIELGLRRMAAQQHSGEAAPRNGVPTRMRAEEEDAGFEALAADFLEFVELLLEGDDGTCNCASDVKARSIRKVLLEMKEDSQYTWPA